MQAIEQIICYFGNIYTSFIPLNKAEVLIIKNDLVLFVGLVSESRDLIMLLTTNHDNQFKFEYIEQKLLNKNEHSSFTYNFIKFIFVSDDMMIMPGFIDSHVHPQMGGILEERVNIKQYSTWEDARIKIKEYIDSKKDEQDWIYIHGFSQGWFKDIGQQVEYLDELCKDKPLLIMRDDLHAYYCNSYLLNLAGISINTEGYIGKENDKLTGLISEESMNLIRAIIPGVDKQRQVNTLHSGIKKLIECGITGFCDAAVKENLLDSYIELYSKQKNDLPWCNISLAWNRLFLEQTQNQDTVLKLDILDNLIHKFQKQNLPSTIQCQTVKLFIDGVLESKTALLNVQYCNCNHHGNLLIDDLKEIIPELIKRDLQIHMHSIGDQATDILVEIFDDLYHRNLYIPNEIQHYAAHLQFMSKKAIQKFQYLNIGACFTPFWFYEDPKYSVLYQMVPKEYISDMYPIKNLPKQNIGFGSDWPVTTPNPLWGIEIAVSRQPMGHSQGFVEIGDLNQCVSIQEALHYYTEGSAKLCMKKKRGTIQNNQQADFIVLSEDLFRIQKHKIHEVQVLATFISGKLVYDNEFSVLHREIF